MFEIQILLQFFSVLSTLHNRSVSLHMKAEQQSSISSQEWRWGDNWPIEMSCSLMVGTASKRYFDKSKGIVNRWWETKSKRCKSPGAICHCRFSFVDVFTIVSVVWVKFGSDVLTFRGRGWSFDFICWWTDELKIYEWKYLTIFFFLLVRPQCLLFKVTFLSDHALMKVSVKLRGAENITSYNIYPHLSRFRIFLQMVKKILNELMQNNYQGGLTTAGSMQFTPLVLAFFAPWHMIR